VPGNERYVAAMAVGAQSGYWKHWRGTGRAGMWFLTHVLLPGISRLHGYFPSRLFGQGEDLPAGVAREWASWCRHPGYIVGALGAEESYARFSVPIRAYAIGDDSYAPPAAVEAFLGFYPNAPRKRIDVDPAQHGGPIGHFGFFRERFRESLWTEAVDWLAKA
jgi:predicted alpha/beta hydrolase